MRTAGPSFHLDSEKEYFYRLDCQLIEKMRERAAREEEHRRMAELYRIEDPRLLEALEKLGYTHRTIVLLELVPLIELAWRDGSVSPAERNWILQFARAHDIAEDIPAWRQLASWLDHCPSPAFFEGTWRAMEAHAAFLSAEERAAAREAIIRACTDFATATCHQFGWHGRICAAKRKVLEEIHKRLERPMGSEPATAGAALTHAA
jgi:hypothetical protein